MLWTLYTSFAYILAALILVLVTGWQNWTALEYTGLSASPLVIYGVRTALDAAFNYRVANSQNQLNDLHKQRDAAIAKLKEATKYNSTQQLLEKYGGSPPKPVTLKQRNEGGQPKNNQPRVAARTGIAPPPTANIPGRPLPGTPQNQLPSPQRQQPMQDPHAEFAPNAFSAPVPRPPSRDFANSSPRWFDRILDVVLGDDETQPKNRIVLICSNCRLVNGQAPPGTTSLEDLGQWRCMACQTVNGSQSQAKEMIQKIVAEKGDHHDEKQGTIKRRATTVDGADDDETIKLEQPDYDVVGGTEHVDDSVSLENEGDGGDVFANGIDSPPAASTRSRTKRQQQN